MMSTYMAKKEDVKREWFLLDAKDQVLGRVATRIANILRGKHKRTFTPHVDSGDFVVVINAAHVKLTGNKWEEKTYYSHSHYMGGIKSITAQKLRDKQPEKIILKAVKGMLPKNFLGDKMLKKLKVYAEGTHPHDAHKPKEIN